MMVDRAKRDIHIRVQARRLILPLTPAVLVPLVTRNLYHPDEIYALAKQLEGDPSSYGTFPLAGARAQYFLYQRQRQPFYEPLSNTAQIIDVLALNNGLQQGYAPEWSLPHISVAVDVFDSMFTAPKGRVPLPRPGEALRGQHLVSLTGHWVGYGEWLQFLNSWGPEWGDNGFGYLSRAYLNKHMVEAWLSRDASVGASPLTHRRFVNAPGEAERARIWLLPNRYFRRRGYKSGRGYQLIVYETFSLADECRVQVVHVRTGFGIRVGWAHLFHIGGEPHTSILKELYVWPSFRRQGFGTILESVALESARAWGAQRLQVLFHELDAQPMLRAAGECFAEQLGYQWNWHPSSRPQVEAIGGKLLKRTKMSFLNPRLHRPTTLELLGHCRPI